MAPPGLPKTSAFAWTKGRVLAAQLVAEDDLSNEEIARRAGVSARTLTAWKKRPEFAAMVGDHIGQLQAGMLKLSIAKKRKRVETLDRLHGKLLTVIEERAADYASNAAATDVPAGGGTGLIVRQLKQIGAGRDAQVVEEFAVDVGTLREIRALEQQAAQELGQWIEKQQIEDLTRVIEIVGVDADLI